MLHYVALHIICSATTILCPSKYGDAAIIVSALATPSVIFDRTVDTASPVPTIYCLTWLTLHPCEQPSDPLICLHLSGHCYTALEARVRRYDTQSMLVRSQGVVPFSLVLRFVAAINAACHYGGSPPHRVSCTEPNCAAYRDFFR